MLLTPCILLYYTVLKEQQNSVLKQNTIYYKHASYQVQTPTCFGTKVPSSANIE